MQQQPTCDQAEQDDSDDWGIMVPLLDQNDHRPWSVAELVAEHGTTEMQAIDAIDRLNRLGLIHRTSDNLIYPTRAALHMHRIRR